MPVLCEEASWHFFSFVIVTMALRNLPNLIDLTLRNERDDAPSASSQVSSCAERSPRAPSMLYVPGGLSEPWLRSQLYHQAKRSLTVEEWMCSLLYSGH